MCIRFFHDSKYSWKAFSGIILSSVVAVFLMESMSEKWVPFRTDLILGRGKSHMGTDRGNMGSVLKLQCFFLQETDKYSGLCEQDRYGDEAPMRWLPKDSASCHALILRDAEKSLYRRFGSLHGLG